MLVSLIGAARWLNFVCKFGIAGVHGVLYVYAPEIFPTSARALGTGVAIVGDDLAVNFFFKTNALVIVTYLARSHAKFQPIVELGQLLSPYVMIIESKWIPFATFGAVSGNSFRFIFTVICRNKTPLLVPE